MHASVQRPSGRSPGSAFAHAVSSLAQRLGTALAPKPTPIATFKERSGDILKEADSGTVQVITQGSKRYVLLSEVQLLAIMEGPESTAGSKGVEGSKAAAHSKVRSLAHTLESLTPPQARLDAGLVMVAGPTCDLFLLPEGAA